MKKSEKIGIIITIILALILIIIIGGNKKSEQKQKNICNILCRPTNTYGSDQWFFPGMPEGIDLPTRNKCIDSCLNTYK